MRDVECDQTQVGEIPQELQGDKRNQVKNEQIAKVHLAVTSLLPVGLTYWRLRVRGTLLDQDTDCLVGQLSDYVRGSLVDGDTVPIKCNDIQVWKHGAATWNTQEMVVRGD